MSNFVYGIKKEKKNKVGKKYFFMILFLVVFFLLFLIKPINFPNEILVKKGDSPTSIFNKFGFIDKTILKIYTKLGFYDIDNLQIGRYVFSGGVTTNEFFDILSKGPEKNFMRVTILEGWSSYDIDKYLTEKDLIKEGEFLAHVSSGDFINSVLSKHLFIKNYGDISSLEGFLYPETYNVDLNFEVIEQVISMQLNEFEKRIYKKYPNINLFSAKSDSANVKKLDLYDLLVLASVIEKEERNIKNKPYVASVFVNRVAEGMQLGADITLCYGLKIPYELCTPSKIVKYLNDKDNKYNTRALNGLPPTPISNVSESTYDALINYIPSNYFYYLHDSSGGIHYGETYEEHLDNKSKYIN